ACRCPRTSARWPPGCAGARRTMSPVPRCRSTAAGLHNNESARSADPAAARMLSKPIAHGTIALPPLAGEGNGMGALFAPTAPSTRKGSDIIIKTSSQQRIVNRLLAQQVEQQQALDLGEGQLRASGYSRASLETGSMAYFAPARR